MALFSAAAKGDVLKIQSLIDSEDKSEDSGGVDVNCSDASGKTPLHIASENGHSQTVKCLTHHGAKVNVVDANLRTSVYLCSKKGHLHVVELLVNEGADIDIGDKDGFTALHIASFKGYVDIVKYLVSKGAQLERLANDYWTPLNLALHGGHQHIAEYLLTEGANINTCGKGGYTALHTASFNGNIEAVKYLTSQGAELDRSTDDGWTALSLSCASEEGHLEVVEYIVNKGADIEIGDKDGLTALHGASFEGHLDIVKYLVKKGAQLDKCDKIDRTPLFCASQEGHLEVVEYIVNEGAGIEIGDKDGYTALSIASFKGHLDIVKYLVRKGAKLDKCDKNDRTSLYWASQEGHLEVVEYIVNKGAGIEIGNKDGVTALHIASLNGHLDIVKYLVSKGADPGKLANEEDHYDYLRSTSPGFMPPYSRTYDPYVTGPRDSSRFMRKSNTKETMSISLDECSIKVPLSPDDVDRAKYITAEALTTIPPDLKLEKDEVIISVGLKLSPPGLQFKTPVEVTVSHSAIFSNPDKAEIVLYTRRTGSDEFSRIVPASDKAARCVVAKNLLTLYLDHFSEWWIISLIRRYFIGKRLICTPYVPLSTSRDDMNYILLNIKDDFCDMKEDTIRDYKVAFPGEQYCVYWGKGPLFVRHLENKEEVSKEELEECAFFDMTTHRMPFNLQSREQIVSRVLVTLILKQKITKKITFPVQYNDVPHENPSDQPTLKGSASSKGKAEPFDGERGASKSSQLPEEQTRSEHHLETIGSTSPEPANKKDRSSPTEALTRPRPLTPPSIESPSCGHAYQVTDDLVTEKQTVALSSSTQPVHSVESAAERKMGAPPAILANIVQEFVPGLSTDRNMHQRSGNVYINVQGMVINNPPGNNHQGNTVAHDPVAIASIVPPRLQHELRCRLNKESLVLSDWRGLADQLGLEDYIQHLEQCKNPTGELLLLAESQKKIQNLEDLTKAFERMNRGDCQELCENYAFEKTKSAYRRKDQMEDDDTDSSD